MWTKVFFLEIEKEFNPRHKKVRELNVQTKNNLCSWNLRTEGGQKFHVFSIQKKAGEAEEIKHAV